MSQATPTGRQRAAIGHRIASTRRSLNLSQSELARRVGIEAQTISKQERGLFAPSAETCIRLADALGVDVRWLICGESEAA